MLSWNIFCENGLCYALHALIVNTRALLFTTLSQKQKLNGKTLRNLYDNMCQVSNCKLKNEEKMLTSLVNNLKCQRNWIFSEKLHTTDKIIP